MALMAEIKRASPSLGDINVHIDPAQQAVTYAKGGAAVISVLTEPKWCTANHNTPQHSTAQHSRAATPAARAIVAACQLSLAHTAAHILTTAHCALLCCAASPPLSLQVQGQSV